LKREIADFENKQFEQEIAVKLKALLHKPNLHIVTLCDWMTEEVKNSEVFHGFPVHKIPNGIDKNVFNLKDKTFCREVLGLPHDKIIVLFVADYIENFRKGYAVLLKALELLKHKDIILCSVGNKAGELVSNEHLIELGEIKDERLMSVIYSAADGFVIPSLMDNLPNTVVESLMCGTPVIGFPVGGIKEMIQINENGVLASEISASGLAEAIDLFLSDYMSFDRNIISQNATHKYATEVMVRNYKQLYQSLLTAE
jgi:glycosyltransferase involved in cell wall biosynthesis